MSENKNICDVATRIGQRDGEFFVELKINDGKSLFYGPYKTRKEAETKAERLFPDAMLAAIDQAKERK